MTLKNRNWVIWFIIAIAFILRISVLIKYGYALTIDSDDQGYIRSAVTFLNTGMITYHNANIPTVHIMPGQTLLLAAIFFFFGTGSSGIIAAKVIMILLGVINVYLVYLLGKYIGNIYIGWITSILLALFVPQILTDNLLLTETPFLTCLLGIVYFSIRLANEHSMKDFYFLMLFYLLAIMFKATIALYPLILLIYLLLKRYPLKLAIKQFFISLFLVLIVLMPWWIRNYDHYHEFIPLTGGSGNPLLLGTYQGQGYKYGEGYDQVIQQIREKNPPNAYEELKLEKEVAQERIRDWWSIDKKSFVKSYFYLKTKEQWSTQFYWIEIFNISKQLVNFFHKVIVILGLLSLVVILLFKNNWREHTFFALLIGYYTMLNNIFFAYDRYNQPLMFIFFILIASVLYKIAEKVKQLV